MDLHLPLQSEPITTDVSDLGQGGGFLRFPNKTDRHDMIEILLKVVLATIKERKKQTNNTIH